MLLGSGGRLFGLMCDRQLQYSRALAALEMRHENDVSVWQFERVMMSVGIVLIYLAKSSNSEVGGLFPNPALIVFYVLIKGQFGPRKQANRDLWFPFRRKAAGPS
jgi:hypothetical protein